ncbi:MAG: NAD(P)/FAD-dependent oxidoreductase [Candidatus Aenigmarchaeota archaeon]|nr:NAD(P)/FAD-dependent oxidoreductase [Candidatus Aenigmarchaeota archaeon]
MTEYDVIVIGGGSAGLNTAINCSKAGLRVAVIEEHSKIGFPRHCSGLYSTRFLSLMEVKEDFYEHEVFGAKFHSPSGKVIELMRKERVAFVINRELLDDFLGKSAQEFGVNVISNSKVLDFSTDLNGATIITTDGKTLTTKLICGADGSNSFIRRKLGIEAPHKLHGIMAITDEADYNNFVDLYFDNKLYPGFFAWKIPRGKTIEYGIAGEVGPNNVHNFNNFLLKFNVTKYELSSGMIPFGFQKSYADRILLVGDAAAQVKPLTGGGVIYGMICASAAANIFKEAIEKNRFDENFLSRYQKMWRSRIGKGISRGLLIRKIYAKMPNKAIDASFAILNNRITKNIFENHGDMEFILERKPHAAILK